MPPGRPTRTSRRAADLLAHLTSIGTLDPTDPAPARIQCARCYRYLPAENFKQRTFRKVLKGGRVTFKTYRMRICHVCHREKEILRKLPPAERQPYVEIGAIVTRLVPLPEGGFAAYDYHGNWLADGESAISIIAELYRNARKTETCTK